MNNYFNRDEFACSCGCGFAAVDAELLAILTLIRVTFNAPVRISSGCRCHTYNTKIGGAKNSMHKKGMAADITVRGVSPEIIYEFLDSLHENSKGLGNYHTFTHVDVRKIKARF